MRCIDLFAGIGGFSLAARWMGWETVAWCEWNEFGQKVLRHHFPKAEGFGDITKTDFTKYANRIDIVTGGFPCQPYSLAGKRKGKEDERHLWPEILRAIREIQPRWVVGENVFGLINWGGGLVFHEVQADLEAEGYEVWAYVLPACAVNAPHRRDRVWFVAHRNNQQRKQTIGGLWSKFGYSLGTFENTDSNGWAGNERQSKSGNGQLGNTSTGNNELLPANNGEAGVNANSNKERAGRLRDKSETARASKGNLTLGSICGVSSTTHTNSGRQSSKEYGQEKPGWTSKKSLSNYWENFPTQSPICGGDDGLPTELDGITFSKWRNESIKAYGNAIVPQVAFEIFKSIEAYNNGRR
jgi:DNA (cytosine-5)-methyltransferase 1